MPRDVSISNHRPRTYDSTATGQTVTGAGPAFDALRSRFDGVINGSSEISAQDVASDLVAGLIITALSNVDDQLETTGRRVSEAGSDGGEQITAQEVRDLINASAQTIALQSVFADAGGIPSTDRMTVPKFMGDMLKAAEAGEIELTGPARDLAIAIRDGQSDFVQSHPQLQAASNSAKGLVLLAQAIELSAKDGSPEGDKIADVEARLIASMTKRLPKRFRESVSAFLADVAGGRPFEASDGSGHEILNELVENPHTPVSGDGPMTFLEKKSALLDAVLTGNAQLTDAQRETEALGYILMYVMGAASKRMQSFDGPGGAEVLATELAELVKITASIDVLADSADPIPQTTDMMKDLLERADAGDVELSDGARAMAKGIIDGQFGDAANILQDDTNRVDALAVVAQVLENVLNDDTMSVKEASVLASMLGRLPQSSQDGMVMMMSDDNGGFGLGDTQWEPGARDILEGWWNDAQQVADVDTPPPPALSGSEKLASDFVLGVMKGPVNDALFESFDAADKPFWNDDEISTSAAVRAEIESDAGNPPPQLRDRIVLKGSERISADEAKATFGDRVTDGLDALAADYPDLELVRVTVGIDLPGLPPGDGTMRMLAMIANVGGEPKLVGVTDDD